MVRVLFIDDDPAILEIGTLYLEEFGHFDIDGFLSADEAFASLLDDPDRYDVIISDQCMPGMHGSNLLTKIRATGITTRFILYSGCDYDTKCDTDVIMHDGCVIRKEGDPVKEYQEIVQWILGECRVGECRD